MKKKTTRLISSILALVMLLSLLPTTALAVESTPITSVKVSDITEPVIGATPDFDITLTGTGFELNEYPDEPAVNWYKVTLDDGEIGEWEPMDRDTPFGAGLYSLEVYLKAEDGYEFSDATKFYYNDDELPEYEGSYESNYECWGEDKYAAIYLYFTLEDPAAPTEITSLSATVTEPVAGASPSFEAVAGGEGYTAEVEWESEDAQLYPEDGYEFKAGEKYYLYVAFNAKEGCEFADDVTITINGKTPENTYEYEDNIVGLVTYTIPAATPTITSVKVSDVTEPVIGATPDFDITLTGDGVVFDEEEYPDGVAWYKVNMSGEFVEWVPMDGDTSFGAGLYELRVALKPEAGYDFTDATKFYYNEYELPAWHDTYDSCYDCWVGGVEIYLYFTVEESATPTEITNLSATVTEPVAGASPSFEAVAGGEGYTAEVEWESEDAQLYPEDGYEFKAGEKYYLYVAFNAKEGCEFADDVTITINGDTPEDIFEHEGKIVALVTYTLPASTPTYTVSFDANGGSGTMADVPGVSGEYTLPANGFTAPSGKAFKCWSVGGEEKAVGDTITVTADTTVTAVWIIPIRTITINGITKPVVGEKAKTSGITLDTEGITISEKHWLKAGTSNHMIDGTYEAGKTYPLLIYYTLADGYEIADDVVITHDLPGAVVTMVKEFSRIRLEYTVAYAITFDANGGSGTMAPVSGIAGEYTLPECTFTAPAGKQFKAWSVGGREKAAGDTITVTADTTLTAVWKDAGIPINAINIMGIPTPIAGQLPIVSGITTDTTGISLGDIIWCTPDSQNMIDRLKFEEGKTYTFSAYYTVDEGYELLSGAALTHDLAGGFNAKIVPSMKFIEIKYTVSAAPTYTVSFDAHGGSGNMEDVPVVYGEYTLPECTFTPPVGKQFKAWSIGDSEKAVGDKITVTANTTVTAVWEDAKILINTISIKGITAPVDRAYPVTTGITTDTPGLTITHAQWNRDIYMQTTPFVAGYTYSLSIYFEVAEGYEISDSVTVDHDLPNGVPGRKNLEAESPWISIDYTVPENLTYTVSFDANGGSVTPASAVTGADGKLTRLPTPTRSGSYTFKGWYTAASGGTKVTASTVFTENTTIYAQWTYTGGGGGGGSYAPVSYAITVVDAKNGDVTADTKSAAKGETVTVTVDPDKGYTLETLTVTDKNGKEIELTNKGDGKYTFKMPASKVTVKATFMDDNTMLNFFVDVPADAYYYDAVLWAVKEGITNGTSATTFSPDASCTRAQMVTFLWRAAGSPEPKSTECKFTDVNMDSYYGKAVLWAVENGITNGTSDTTFSPDATCTRAQMATFLCRMADGKPVSSTNAFTDVKADAYYADPVQWAVENGITNGTGDNKFSPDATCTRAQMVTFLYRYFVQ